MGVGCGGANDSPSYKGLGFKIGGGEENHANETQQKRTPSKISTGLRYRSLPSCPNTLVVEKRQRTTSVVKRRAITKLKPQVKVGEGEGEELQRRTAGVC